MIQDTPFEQLKRLKAVTQDDSYPKATRDFSAEALAQGLVLIELTADQRAALSVP